MLLSNKKLQKEQTHYRSILSLLAPTTRIQMLSRKPKMATRQVKRAGTPLMSLGGSGMGALLRALINLGVHQNQQFLSTPRIILAHLRLTQRL